MKKIALYGFFAVATAAGAQETSQDAFRAGESQAFSIVRDTYAETGIGRLSRGMTNDGTAQTDWFFVDGAAGIACEYKTAQKRGGEEIFVEGSLHCPVSAELPQGWLSAPVTVSVGRNNIRRADPVLEKGEITERIFSTWNGEAALLTRVWNGANTVCINNISGPIDGPDNRILHVDFGCHDVAATNQYLHDLEGTLKLMRG